MKYLIILATATVLLFSVRDAKALSGNELKGYCAKPEGSFEYSLCIGYITGSLDSYVSMEKLSVIPPKSFCLPNGVTNGQFLAMTKKNLEDHPEQLHFIASSFLLEMIGEAFPCN